MKIVLKAAIACFTLAWIATPVQAQTKNSTISSATGAAKKKTTTVAAKRKTVATKTNTAVAKAKTTTAADSTKAVVKDTVAYTKPVVAEESVTAKTQVVQTSQKVAATPAYAAAPVKATPPAFQNPFKKGTVSFINKRNLDYANYKESPTNTKVSDLSVGVDVNYFFLNNLAIGVDLRYSNYSSKPSPTSTYYYYDARLQLTYGRNITPRLSVYGRVGAGLGHSKSGPNQVLEADYKDLFVTIGAPIAFVSEGSLFLTPYAEWGKYKTKAANHDITEKGFTFGVRMESYLNNSNAKKSNQPISPWPKKRVSFIEYLSSASYGFSKRVEYQGTIRFGDVKKSNAYAAVGYNYYFLDYLAGGLYLSYSRTSSNNGSPDVRRTITLQPTVTVNAPVETSLKNLFFQVAYAISKTKNTGSKEDANNLGLRLGYNIFLAKNISFSPKIGYDIYNSTHHTAGGDYKYKDTGLAIEFGVRAWLNTTNWFAKK